MMQTDGLNILLAWLCFGILLAVLAWLLLRSGQDDALSSIARPDPDQASRRPGEETARQILADAARLDSPRPDPARAGGPAEPAQEHREAG